MEEARLAEEYISTLAWPGVALLAIFLFRIQIRDLIGRIQWFRTPGGGEAYTPTQPQEPPPKPPTTQPPEEGSPPSIPPTDNVEQLKAFVFYWFYEKSYRLLYGTQIKLLAYLNTFGSTGVHFSTLLPFFQEHKAEVGRAVPNYERSWPQYIGFLQSLNFISIEEETYRITDLGRHFLQWMAAEGLSHMGKFY